MAIYNTKYTLKYCNRKGIPLTIDIQQRDYTGESFIIVNEEDYLLDDDNNYIVMKRETYTPDRDISNIIGSSMPFMLEYRNDKEGKLCNIMATSARMAFWSDLTFNIDDLKTSDETNLKVNFYYNNELEWTGFVVPDFFTEDIASISEVNLTASDRLGVLKDIPYSFDDTKDTRVSLMYILDKCIKNTGLDLPYEVIADFGCVEVSEFELYNPFAITYVYERRFIESESKNMNCYNIMQKILMQFNCRLVQRKGKWTIINKQQIEIGNGFVRGLSSDLIALSENPSFIQPENNFSLISTGGQRTIIPVNSIATVELNVGETQVYPINRTLKGDNNFIPSLTVPFGWTRSGLGYDLLLTNQVPAEYDAAGNITDVINDSRIWALVNESRKRIEFWNGFNDVLGIDVRWPYLQSKSFNLPSNDGKRVSFDVTIKGVGKPNSIIGVMALIEFEQLPGQYYSVTTDGKILNITVSMTSLWNTENIMMFKFDNAYNNPLVAVEQEFKISLQKATTDEFDAIDLRRAKMTIRLYPSLHDDNTAGFVARNVVKSIAIDFKSSNETPKKVIHEAENETGVFTKKYEAEELIFGDYETEGQNGYFYQYRDDSLSITYNEIGHRTQKWFTIGDTSDTQPLLTHLARQYAKALGTATDELNISFETELLDPIGMYAFACWSNRYIEIQNKLLIDDKQRYIMAKVKRMLDNKRYILSSGSIDYMRCEADVLLSEKQNKSVTLKEYIYTDF